MIYQKKKYYHKLQQVKLGLDKHKQVVKEYSAFFESVHLYSCMMGVKDCAFGMRKRDCS